MKRPSLRTITTSLTHAMIAGLVALAFLRADAARGPEGGGEPSVPDMQRDADAAPARVPAPEPDDANGQVPAINAGPQTAVQGDDDDGESRDTGRPATDGPDDTADSAPALSPHDDSLIAEGPSASPPPPRPEPTAPPAVAALEAPSPAQPEPSRPPGGVAPSGTDARADGAPQRAQASPPSARPGKPAPELRTEAGGTAAMAAAKLAAAYPGFIARAENNAIVWKDGTRMTVDDGRAKTPGERLELADLEDQFFDVYPAGRPTEPPPKDFDPGRARFEPFFQKMYGDCRTGGVEKTLTAVRWLPSHGGGTIKATTINGVAARLQQVSDELDKLPKSLMRYLKPAGGVFDCRPIAGTARLSMHAYAAAIDINPRYGDYWQWSGGKRDTLRYRNRIPWEIVEIFEKHGFIWGGKWYHYDTLHFEYRPELLPPMQALETAAANPESAPAAATPAKPRPEPGGGNQTAAPGETITLPMPVRQPRTIR